VKTVLKKPQDLAAHLGGVAEYPGSPVLAAIRPAVAEIWRGPCLGNALSSAISLLRCRKKHPAIRVP